VSGVTIPRGDPTFAQAAFKANHGTPVEQARTTDEIRTLLERWNAGTSSASRKGLRDAVVNRRQEMDRRLTEGRVGDAADALSYTLAGIDIIATTAPYIATALGSAPGTALAVAARQGLKDFTEITKTVVALPAMQDAIKDMRARNGAAARAQLTKDLGGALDPSVAALNDALRNDPTGELKEAAKDLWPKEMAGGDLSPGAVIQACPDVFPPNIVLQVQQDNSVLIEDIEKLRATLTDQFGGLGDELIKGFGVVQGQLATINQVYREIGGTQTRILELQFEEKASQEQKDRIEAARKLAADTMAAVSGAMQSGVMGAAAIASLFDKKLAGDIGRVGGAAVQAAQSAAAFGNAVSALSKGVNSLSALGCAAATGNLIGAVVGLVGLFIEEGPTPDELILEQVGELQRGLESLRTELRESFDRIDRQLNQIYDDVMGALHNIATVVNMTHEVALDIQRRMIQQEIALARLAHSMTTFFKAAERADLWQHVNAGLGYADRSATPMTADQFNDYASNYHTWATVLAFDTINQPLTGRPVDDDALTEQLGIGDLADNISYINRVLTVRDLPALVPDVAATRAAPLPNPMIWSIASAAFAQLCSEWPTLANTSGTAKRREELQEVGHKYQAAIQALAKDQRLIPGLIEKYEQAVTKYGEVLDGRRDEFQKNVLPFKVSKDPNNPRPGLPCQIFGSDDQELNFWPDLSKMHSVDGGPDLTLPAELASRINRRCRLAAWFTPETTHFSANYVVTGTATIPRPPAFPGGKPHHGPLPWQVNITLTINVTFDGQLIDTFTTDYRTHKLRGGPPPETWLQPFIRAWIQDNWEAGQNVRHKWLSQVKHVPAASPAADDATRKITAEGFAKAREEFYTYLADQTSHGPCAAAASRVDGQRMLLEGVLRMLLSQPRTGDDVLRAVFDGAPAHLGGALLPGRNEYVAALSGLRRAELTGDANERMRKWACEQTIQPVRLLKYRCEAWRQAVLSGQFTNPVLDTDSTLHRLSMSTNLIKWEAALAAPLPEEDIVAQLPQIARGQKGSGVARVQGLLRAADTASTDAKLKIDGVFGPNTQSAVKSFQQQHQLTADGVVGAQTWRALLGL
jgi:type II secretory pathway pseudopilin PulG